MEEQASLQGFETEQEYKTRIDTLIAINKPIVEGTVARPRRNNTL